MGLTSALSIGRTALAAYQAALQVAGQNIANVATPGYTRTSADLSAISGPGLRVGQLGNGVQITGIRRNISEALQTRLRTAVSDLGSSAAEKSTMGRLESVLDPLGTSNLGSLLSEFFGAIGDLQNTPENTATRGIVINTAMTLVGRIRDMRGDLTRGIVINTAMTLVGRIRDMRGDLIAIRADLNTEIVNAVDRADELATAIASLNQQVTLAEAGSGGPASSLRDRRDQLLSELSELFNTTVREQPTGAVNVYIGNEALVQFGESFGINAVPRFKINNGPVEPTSGIVEGLITSRDVHNQSQFSRLDSLAAGLINEVNKVHSGGKGLVGYDTLTGLTGVLDSTVALSMADNGLAFVPQTGSFFIDLRDNGSGTIVRTQINIDLDGIGPDTTLDSLAADINANVANITATVLASGKLQLTAANGYTFSFGDDTSGALAALGINTFFSGKDSLDIGVNSLITGNNALLAAGTSDLPGDGSNATALVGVQDLAVASLGGVSLNDYYTATMATLAVSASAVNSADQAAQVIFDSLTVQRESISGVNLDEEAVALISFQRAYEGVARYMRVVDDMMQTLLTLVR